jgi:hypothetical protein
VDKDAMSLTSKIGVIVFAKDNRYKALISTFILAIASLVGIPLKATVKQLHDEAEKNQTNITVAPIYWTAYMSKTYARGFMTLEYPTWGRAEWRSLLKLWGKESAWNHHADNPDSTAYGIAQVLNTKPGTPAPLQIEKGLEYIHHRYGKPSIAWAHWRKHGWY